MKKSFKILIEVSKRNVSGIDAEYRWIDILFHDSTRTFDKADIVAKYKEMMRMSKGFYILTISLVTRRDEGNWMDKEDIISSVRFVNDNTYSDDIESIKYGKWTGFRYGNPIGDGERDFTPTNKKNILGEIEEIVYRGNNAFIEMLKEIK